VITDCDHIRPTHADSIMHCGSQYLHPYLAEFNFQYDHCAALEINDTQRTLDAPAAISRKRLTRDNRSSLSQKIVEIKWTQEIQYNLSY
jgi:hypothetical protein